MLAHGSGALSKIVSANSNLEIPSPGNHASCTLQSKSLRRNLDYQIRTRTSVVVRTSGSGSRLSGMSTVSQMTTLPRPRPQLTFPLHLDRATKRERARWDSRAVPDGGLLTMTSSKRIAHFVATHRRAVEACARDNTDLGRPPGPDAKVRLT